MPHEIGAAQEFRDMWTYRNTRWSELLILMASSMHRNLIISILLLLLSGERALGQPRPSDTLFRSPVDIPIYLSGNFGELRPGHFHTGIDIKTQGVTGKRIHAIGPGHVSRIKVSEWGYGKALYIDHPSGFTSVYGHLKEFSPHIREFLRKIQYKEERNILDLKPGSTKLPIKEGEVIAFSGNSGSSGGPHLHFEIRETLSEKPLNPLRFGFDIRDRVAPLLKGLRIHPGNDSSLIDNKNVPSGYYLRGGNGAHRLADNEIPVIHGKAGFAIRTIDKFSGQPNPCGIYELKAFRNGELFFHFKMDRLDFSKNRYINAHVDYRMFSVYGKDYHRAHLLPNNELPIYLKYRHDGWLRFKPDSVYRMKFVVKDYHGNTSRLKFKVKGASRADIQPKEYLEPTYDEFFEYDDPNVLKKDGFSLYMPPNALYQDQEIQYDQEDTLDGSITPLYRVHNQQTPVHYPYRVRLRVNDLAQDLKEKALIVSVSNNGYQRAHGGRFRHGWIETRVRRFGGFTVKLDTTPPKISPIRERVRVPGQKRFRFFYRVTDNLSGVEEYDAYIDGTWVVCYYDAKNRFLSIRGKDLPEPLSKGKHRLKLVVRDERGNKEVRWTTFEIM